MSRILRRGGVVSVVKTFSVEDGCLVLGTASR